MSDSSWDLFSGLRGKARRGIVIEALGATLLAFVIYFLASFAADRTLRLEWPFRAIMLAIFVWFIGRIMFQRLLRPLRFELTDDEMALAVERRSPGIRQLLISAIQFDRALIAGLPADWMDSPELMRTVVSDLKSRVDSLPFHKALEGKRIARFLLIAVGSLVVTAGVGSQIDMGLWLRRNVFMSGEDWPRATQFTWQDGKTRVPQGDPLKLQVTVDGPLPDQVFLHYAFAGGESGTEAMSQTGEDRLFTFEMESVLENATFYVTGGDGLSETLKVEVVERPRIEDLQLTIVFPDYMQTDPRPVSATEGDVRLPLGSKVRIAARSHKDLAQAFLVYGQGDQTDLELVGSREFRGEFAPEASGLLTVDVIDSDDLGAGKPPKIYLRLAEDKAPRLDYKTNGIGNLITSRARLPGTIKIKDDYGLRTLKAEFKIAGVPESEGMEGMDKIDPDTIPWERAEMSGIDQFQDGEPSFESPTILDLRPLLADPEDETSAANRIRPGNLVSVRFQATDNFGPGSPHVGESEVLTFRVVTTTKLVEELMRRQIEQRQELREILKTEQEHLGLLKEILNPTSSDSRAAQARAKLRSISREQKAAGRRVRFVAERYALIIDEYRNNRIMGPSKAQELRDLISQPLFGLADAEFPTSARTLARFAASGDEAARDSCVETYAEIVKKIEAILKHMQEAENLAALIEELRRVIKLEQSAIDDVEKRLNDAAAGVFGPGNGKKDADKKDADKKDADEKNK